MEHRPPHDEVLAHRIGVGVVGVFLALLLSAATGALLSRQPLAELTLLLAVALGLALLADRRARRGLARRRAEQEASFTRMLQGLSRSVSPEAVVSGLVEELRRASGADHVVLARIRPAERVLEATLVAGPGVPPSTTYLPADVLAAGAESADPGLVAGRVAARLRDAYGLRNLLVAPLVVEDGRLVGALVLSRRTAAPWPMVSRELLDATAAEVAAALARAFAHRAAVEEAALDALTGLPNRRHFDELATLLARGRRHADALGVLMIDVDHFKRLNDRYGHAVGDIVLRAVGRAIAGAVRGEDTPARYGGEEFVVLLRRADRVQAVEVAERVRAAVGALDTGELGIAEPVSVSIGVAVADGRPTLLPELVERADQALYEAKRRGRDRVVLEVEARAA